MTKKKLNNKYAAKLLFQFRVIKNGKPNKRRLCEEKIIIITASNADEAYNKLIEIGNSSRTNYKNNLGENVFYECVGILELLKVDESFEKNEVWNEFKTMLTPKERKKKIVPTRRQLNAVNLENKK